MNQNKYTDRSVSDSRIKGYTELPTPNDIINQHPFINTEIVTNTRNEIHQILNNEDKRILVIVGPCSIHNQDAAYEYADKLNEFAKTVTDNLLIVMRVYFEKPRTTVGWKGLINDPNLNDSFDINKGLALARQILIDINNKWVPCGSEFLDTTIPQYISDTVAWGAIGARTTESQIHREMTSGISCPVGFKNGTDGSIKIAADAVLAATSPHHFLAITPEGKCAIAETTGNKDTHIILRGGSTGTNYDEVSINNAIAILEKANLNPKLMVDCSHANSNKEFKRQIDVANDLAKQIKNGQAAIMGVMLESNLVEGKQNLTSEKELTFGQSITDACLGWEDTVSVLENLANAVASR